MSTWTPTAAPKLMRDHWVPPVDVHAPLCERAVLALESALQKRRDQARQLRAPQPMGVCLAAAARARQPPSEHARAPDPRDDDRMEDVESDAMSASDFGALSHASMDDDALRAAEGDSPERVAREERAEEEDEEEEGEEEEEYDDDDDDNLARFL